MRARRIRSALAGREHRQLDVQLVDVLFFIVPVHLHHDRRLRSGPVPHRLVFEFDALDQRYDNPSQSALDLIDADEKVNMLSSAAYEYEASARELALAYEAELAKLRQKYLDRVVSIQ